MVTAFVPRSYPAGRLPRRRLIDLCSHRLDPPAPESCDHAHVCQASCHHGHAHSLVPCCGNCANKLKFRLFWGSGRDLPVGVDIDSTLELCKSIRTWLGMYFLNMSFGFLKLFICISETMESDFWESSRLFGERFVQYVGDVAMHAAQTWAISMSGCYFRAGWR